MVTIDRRLRQIGRSNDGTSRSKQIQLCMEIADAAHFSAGGKQLAQRLDVADTFSKIA